MPKKIQTRRLAGALRNVDARYALWGVALLLLAATPVLAGYGGLGWELSQIAGLVGALACVALCGAPIRRRDSVPPTLLTLRLHTLIGCGAPIAMAIHVGGLVLADRTVVEYLKPTTPVYQLAGIGASIVLLVVLLTSTARARRRVYANHRRFQATHVVLACLLVALIAVHVVTTDRYVGGHGRRALLVAVTIGGLLMLLRSRGQSGAVGGALRPQRRLVFGRNSTFVLTAVLISAAAVGGLLRDSAVAALREPLVTRAHAIPLDFPHSKHFAVNCLQCHHNYADGRGMDSCVACHRSNRTDIKAGVEARFHGFCFDCHRQRPTKFTGRGPVSGCAACHQLPGTTELRNTARDF